MTPTGDLADGGKTSNQRKAAQAGRAGDRGSDGREAVKPLSGPARPSTSQAREILAVATLAAQAAGARGPDVDDVVQIVAEKLLTKWNARHVVAARARSGNGWHAYIAVAARNAYRDLLRARKRARDRQSRAVCSTWGEALPERPGVKRPQPGPASNVDRYLARRLLIDLIEGCPMTANQRQVVALDLVDGLTTAEIADRTGLSAQTVARCRRKGLSLLRYQLLDRSGAEDQPA